MITGCYVKGCFDFGIGKCAVVIVDDVKPNEPQPILHQVAWKVPSEWEYNGEVIKADQQNCEILAATYAVQWCMQNHKGLVNIYTNTTTCEKWYYRQEFPECRALGKAYADMVDAYYKELDSFSGRAEEGRIYAEYMPKNSENTFNRLVNELVEKVR